MEIKSPGIHLTALPESIEIAVLLQLFICPGVPDSALVCPVVRHTCSGKPESVMLHSNTAHVKEQMLHRQPCKIDVLTRGFQINISTLNNGRWCNVLLPVHTRFRVDNEYKRLLGHASCAFKLRSMLTA